MEMIENKILLCENAIKAGNSSPKIAIIMISRYYSAYLMGKNDIYLQKSYYVATKAYELYPSNIDLFLYTVYLNIEMRNTDKSYEMLNSFKVYANFYKSKDPRVYATYLFLLASLELKFLNERNVSKHILALEEFAMKQKGYICDEILSYIYIKVRNTSKAYSFLESAYNKGSRSIFMYLTFYEIYKLGGRYFENKIIISFLKWANNNRIIGDSILDKNNNLIKALVNKNLSLFESIYSNLDTEWLLIEICKSYQDNKDYSMSAYKAYKEAEKKQIYIQEFNKGLIISSFVNGIEEIARYSMEFFIKSNKIHLEIKPFIYHILLTKKKLGELITNYNMENQILEFAKDSINQGLTGRYYNSIYRYALEHIEDASYKNIIENHLYKELFVFKVFASNPLIGYVWVNEREKKEVKVYKVENKTCEIKVSANYFRIICLDVGQKNTIDEEVVLQKQIENADVWLYKYFLKKGYEDIEILIALSSHCLSMRNPTEEIVEILNKTISFKSLSQAYKMQINAVLGNALFLQNRYDKALEYYNEVDENYLNERYIEIMFKVFMNMNEYDKAIKLIINKSQLITEKTLLNALKILAENQEYHPVMANSIYELLIKGYYDTNLLEIVLEHYTGGQEEWQILDKSLSSMSIYHIRLDEIILENSIWTRSFTSSAQSVFLRMYEMSVQNDFTDKFMYYTCFEVLTNSVLPEFDIIRILEQKYMEEHEEIVGYALSHIYLRSCLKTIRSEQIIKDTINTMEMTGIILPVFKEVANKEFLTPYIEKNQCFTYKSLPNKEVCLYYRSEHEKDFIRVYMKYVKFGMYMAVVPMFYDEKIIYYFSESTEVESIRTPESVIYNSEASIKNDINDRFFTINNALIYSEMFKYSEVENIIATLLKPANYIVGKIL